MTDYEAIYNEASRVSAVGHDFDAGIAAVVAAARADLMEELGAVEAAPATRPNTPDVKTEFGKRITVKRCCNGCNRELGDATDAELDAAITGARLPDTRDECGCAE